MKSLKNICVLIWGLILLQGCSTYKNPVTLQQAAREEKAVKIITVDDGSHVYKYIVYEDGQFYGVKNNPGEDVKYPIDADEVAEVLMKKGFPTWIIIVLSAVVGSVLFWLIVAVIEGGYA